MRAIIDNKLQNITVPPWKAST